MYPGDDSLDDEEFGWQARSRYLPRPEEPYPLISLSYRYPFPHTCSPYELHAVGAHHGCRNAYSNRGCQNFPCVQCGEDPCDGPDQMTVHMRMWQLGNKYIVEGLQALVAVELRITCKRYWSSPEFLEV